MSITDKMKSAVDLVRPHLPSNYDFNFGDFFARFVSDPSRIGRFKSICDGLTQVDLDSLCINNPGESEDQVFFAHDLTFQLIEELGFCLLYTSPSPRDQRGSRMPSSA